MSLTEVKIKNAKPQNKTTKLYDIRGLYLEVAPSGGKWWRFKYRYSGKEKRLSLGTYPDVKLKKARERRDEMRSLLADDIDPSENRKAIKASKIESSTNSFETVAREWHEKYRAQWTKGHAHTILRRLEREVFPWLGKKPIADILPIDILSCLRRIEQRGILETAHRVMQCCGQVFRYGVATGRVERNPVVDLKGALPPVKSEHFAAITDPKNVGELMRAIDGFKGTFVVKSALKLAPLVFVRPGELRKAEWKDIDFESNEWRYVVKKTDTPHIVPLSSQAVEILKELEPLTGDSQYVFPSARSYTRPMSENAILSALRRMEYSKDEMSGHGFRAMARTIIDEVLGFRPEYIEHQLAHSVKDPNGRAYNRTAHLSQRRQMMQAWSDYLDRLKAGANVVPLKRKEIN